MTPEERASRTVNGWVDQYRIYLKDGGGAKGVHPQAKEALIAAVAEAIVAAIQAAPPSAVTPALPTKKKAAPSKPRTQRVDAANADEA